MTGCRKCKHPRGHYKKGAGHAPTPCPRCRPEDRALARRLGLSVRQVDALKAAA